MATPCTATLMTSGGVGAIAVVRLQGIGAAVLADSFFKPASDEKSLAESSPQSLLYGTILENEEVLDDVIASCTRQGDFEVIDICLHGGRRIIERMLLLLENRGVTVTKAGGQADPFSTLLSHTRTRRAVRFLATQQQHNPHILKALANAEPAPHGANPDRYRAARYLIEGAQIVIAGPPNAGKSTLVNRLAGRDHVLVSDLSGTTRDWTTHEIAIEGVPINLTDTAGIHTTADSLEDQAIQKGKDKLQQADMVLVVLDATGVTSDSNDPRAIDFKSPDNKNQLLVLNKIDLLPTETTPSHLESGIAVSAETGQGVDVLQTRILEQINLLEASRDCSPDFFC